MDIKIYDFEVFAYDWLVVFKDHSTKEYTIFHNDLVGFQNFINSHEDTLFVGFNSKHYDQYMVKGLMHNANPEELKGINDVIIRDGRQGWEIPYSQFNHDEFVYYKFNDVDVKDDMQDGLSLKAIEGHLFMDIEESSVPFDITRPLTDEEIKETIFYCKHDVDATEMIFDMRKNYFDNKIMLGKFVDLAEPKAMAMTNAKLTAKYLDAEPVEFDDERNYKFPTNILYEYIPTEVIDFFKRLYDKNISDEECFKASYDFKIGECNVTIAFGGIHGAIPHYIEKATEDRIISNRDVASYYPHLMTLDGYTSRAIPNPQIYADMLETRIQAKKSGDKATANALKLVANTTYGCMLNKYNNLYDPLMCRSVCITGQLRLLELAMHIVNKCSTAKIIQLNTDGVMLSLDKSEYEVYNDICSMWQTTTGYELEEDHISAIYQKDVNNYIEVALDGSTKLKGGYVVRGVADAGAFKVNNNATIIADAIVDYFVRGIDVEDTINNCDDIKKYQMICKTGSMYKRNYWVTYGEQVDVNRCNRVYASIDKNNGTIYKCKDGQKDALVGGLPDHCIVDNRNVADILQIDKEWYIEQAKAKINDFLGIDNKKHKEKKKMAKTTEISTMNAYQKLIKARAMFLESDVKKTGKNMHMEFKYFELDDIVPTITKIFNEIGLCMIVQFDGGLACGNVVNTDNPDDRVLFTIPMVQIQAEDNSFTKIATAIQSTGSLITYYRRYFYLMAMDIVESDGIDATNGTKTETKSKAKAKIPVSDEKREEKKTELTSVDAPADALQVKGLKKALKELIAKDETAIELLNEISQKTDAFTNLTKKECEDYIIQISERMNA